jgi:hypothetical protein
VRQVIAAVEDLLVRSVDADVHFSCADTALVRAARAVG